MSVQKQTLINVETGRNSPSRKLLSEVSKCFNKYTLWLMTGEADESCGQINPEVEQMRKTLKQTGAGTD